MTVSNSTPNLPNTTFNADSFRDKWTSFKYQVKKLVAGNDDVIELILTSMFSDGHVILESVPGLGKTVLGNAMCAALKGGRSGFFPFTADLLPGDIRGTEVYNEETRKMEVMFGACRPDFNIFVADEFNRTNPKTQSAMLSIMEERRIVINDQVFYLADPSIVIGTQNPIEQEGTYPLSEAVRDRFAMMGKLDYLNAEDEVGLLRNKAIYSRDPQGAAKIEAVMTPEDIRGMRDFVRETVVCTDSMTRYIVRLMRATRPSMDEFKKFMPEEYRKMVLLGGSQRTSKWVSICSAAAAAMRGSDTVGHQDVQKVFSACVAHKMMLTPDVKARRKGENVAEQILAGLIASVPTAA